MSTRSTIAIANNDGKILSIYCHFDGYPEGVGQVLRHYYTEEDKIKSLINLGDISVLDEFVEPVGTQHSFDTPEVGVTIAYGRDRKEEGTTPKEYPTFRDWLAATQSKFSMIDYAYLWDGSEWQGWDCFSQEAIDWSKVNV